MTRDQVIEIMARAICAAEEPRENPDELAGRLLEPETKIWQEHIPAALSCLAALEAAGYVVVPAEPTEAMIGAVTLAMADEIGSEQEPDPTPIWSAMLSAAKG